ncbi:MAG: Tat pathway signal protein [Xanthobacter sp. 17-67-6]|nr:MAG: Tat pathway signal protein [Xanthobacter sp. 17-67-6]
MKLVLPAVAATATLLSPVLAEARQVTFETTLKNYGGNGAYVVLYVTDASGAYKGTLWMAGGKAKYYRHLSDWQRASGGRAAEIDGITGASVGSGKTLKITLDLADAMIDAGYKVHVDTAVEDGMDNPSEVVAPLAASASGKPVAGKGYVKSFTVTF